MLRLGYRPFDVSASMTPIQTTRLTSSSSMGSSGSGGFHGWSPSSLTTSAIRRVISPGDNLIGNEHLAKPPLLADAPRRFEGVRDAIAVFDRQPRRGVHADVVGRSPEEGADLRLEGGRIGGAHPFLVDVAARAVPRSEGPFRERIGERALGLLGARKNP